VEDEPPLKKRRTEIDRTEIDHTEIDHTETEVRYSVERLFENRAKTLIELNEKLKRAGEDWKTLFLAPLLESQAEHFRLSPDSSPRSQTEKVEVIHGQDGFKPRWRNLLGISDTDTDSRAPSQTLSVPEESNLVPETVREPLPVTRKSSVFRSKSVLSTPAMNMKWKPPPKVVNLIKLFEHENSIPQPKILSRGSGLNENSIPGIKILSRGSGLNVPILGKKTMWNTIGRVIEG